MPERKVPDSQSSQYNVTCLTKVGEAVGADVGEPVVGAPVVGCAVGVVGAGVVGDVGDVVGDADGEDVASETTL